jgi:hypothetical protein
MKKIGLAFLIGFYSIQAWAAKPYFEDITEDDLRKIARDFGAVFVHNPVSPASWQGPVFNFELGILFGVTQTPGVESLIRLADPNAEVVASVPFAGFLGVITLPNALTTEISFLPSYEMKDVRLKIQTVALKWTLSDTLSEIPTPYDFALRAHYSAATFKYEQDINTFNTKVEISESIMGVGATLSRRIVILEPYLGFGYLWSEGTVNLSGSDEEFFAFTARQTASAKAEAFYYHLGLNMNVMGSRFGFEAGRAFESSKACLKLATTF